MVRISREQIVDICHTYSTRGKLETVRHIRHYIPFGLKEGVEFINRFNTVDELRNGLLAFAYPEDQKPKVCPFCHQEIK